MVTIQDIKDRMGQDRINDYLYDSTGTKTSDQILTLCLHTGNLLVKSYCNKYKHDFDDTDEIQIEAIQQFTISEVYAYSNSEKTGLDEKELARDLLLNYWQISAGEDSGDEAIPSVTPIISVTKATGRQYISDIDIFKE